MAETVHMTIDPSGPVATGTGAGITVFSWLATWDWGFLIGVMIGLAGLAISYANYRSNKAFQKRKDQREQEIHALEKKRLENKYNAKQD